jgi:DNA-directed RNA polymerase subunit alpha
MSVRYGRFEMPKTLVKDESSATETYAKFVAEPFEAGYGHTVGNSLRRVLLSSLEGAAITAVKINGAQHEFGTLPAVVEDVTDIVLNLKRVKFKASDHEARKLALNVNKEGTVTAGDIQLVQGYEVLNPKQVICTLDKKHKFEAELDVRVGRGFATGDENKRPDQAIGLIPIDSIFSPVTRVKYAVENTRVGQRTDYDKLTLDVTTDGSVSPKDAIAEAAEILIRQLAIFTDLDKIEGFGEQLVSDPDVQTTSHGMENFPIEELELGVRSYNCLKRVGIETIGDLTSKSENELAAIPNFGRKSIEEVRETLAAHGLTLKGEELPL